MTNLEEKLERLEAECKRIQTELASLREAAKVQENGIELEIEDVSNVLHLGRGSDPASLLIRLALHWKTDGEDVYAGVGIRMLRKHDELTEPEVEDAYVLLSARFEDTLDEFTDRILEEVNLSLLHAEGGVAPPTFEERSQEILSRIHTQWIGALK